MNATLDEIGFARIRPELVAAKVAAIRNYEQPELLRQVTARPQLLEVMWFLQAMSLQPGGLVKFTEDLLAAFPERIGTATMIGAKGREFSTQQKLEILCELPERLWPDVDLGVLRDVVCSGVEWEKLQPAERASMHKALRNFDADYFSGVCRREAMDRLPHYFFSLCTDKGKGFRHQVGHEQHVIAGDFVVFTERMETWYFDQVIEGVIAFMDRRAKDVAKRLAMTAVAKQVFEALDFALEEKSMVRIEGPSRFGKTEAMAAWCAMRPGLARLVRVPSSNSMGDFFKRIGDALGIDSSYGSDTTRLRERIEYVIQHSGLFLVLDEAAFLIPQNYSATTPPHRLNWVRTEIVDRGLPVAIAVTPQAYKSAVDRFVKKTSYRMEQWTGRVFMTATLPDSLSEDDMIAVARIHFPEMDEDILELIACEADLSQNYLHTVEEIARVARFKARRAGRPVGLAEVKFAINAAKDPSAKVEPRAEEITPKRGDLRPVKGPLKAGYTADRQHSKLDLDRCSLRGTGDLVTEEAGLVSAEP